MTWRIFGIDYSKSIYYVQEYGDEEEKVDFRYLCYYIGDISTFENTIKTKMQFENIEKKGELNVMNFNYYNKLYWNDSYALLIEGNYTGYDFYGDYYETATEETTYYEIEETINSIDTITSPKIWKTCLMRNGRRTWTGKKKLKGIKKKKNKKEKMRKKSAARKKSR